MKTIAKEAGAFDFAVSTVFADGSQGGLDLAEKVLAASEEPSEFSFLYDVNDSIQSKISTIATKIYGAGSVTYSDQAKADKVVKKS